MEADQAGRASQASRVPARPASPGSPSRAPSRGCGKASRSAQLNRFPVPPAPAPRLPAAQDKPSALHPPVPRSRPRGSAPSRGESLPNRPSKDRATGWAALKPYLQGGWRRHRGKSPRLGAAPPAGAFPGDRKLTPVLRRLLALPEIAALPSPRRRRVPTTPQHRSGRLPGAYLRVGRRRVPGARLQGSSHSPQEATWLPLSSRNAWLTVLAQPQETRHSPTNRGTTAGAAH